MIRRAQCCCGGIAIECDGDGDEIVICNCIDCQRRTGAPFGVSHYYAASLILARHGSPKIFTRTGSMGTVYHFHFCPDCGSTVYWTVEGSDEFGVSGGCFAASDMRKPDSVVYVSTAYRWIEHPDDLPWYDRGHSSPCVHEGRGPASSS